MLDGQRILSSQREGQSGHPVCVHEGEAPISGRDGRRYMISTFAEIREDDWIAWHVFAELDTLPASAIVASTGPETRQRTLARVDRWLGTLGPYYWDSALARALQRARVRPRDDVVVVREFPFVPRQDGRTLLVKILARAETSGSWVGWLRFCVDGAETALETGHEMSQPSLDALRYWAQRVGTVYVEGALDRARPAPPNLAPAESA